MISATPALSSAPSSVSPLEVTMSWPTAFASSASRPGSSTVPPRGSSIRDAVVGAVHDRLDARTWRVRTRVDVRDQADRSRPVAGQRRGDVAVVVQRGVGEPDRQQLLHQQPAELQLSRRTRALLAVALGLGVDADVAQEALQHVRGEVSARVEVAGGMRPTIRALDPPAQPRSRLAGVTDACPIGRKGSEMQGYKKLFVVGLALVVMAATASVRPPAGHTRPLPRPRTR